MYRKVLLCYDGSREGRNALREGADVALAMACEAHLLAIVRPQGGVTVPDGYTAAWVEHEDEAARAILDEGVGWLRERGLAATGELAFGSAIQNIVRAAKQTGAELIVVGHRRRSRLARWWTEGEDATLLECAPCSILVAVQPE